MLLCLILTPFAGEGFKDALVDFNMEGIGGLGFDGERALVCDSGQNYWAFIRKIIIINQEV